VIIHNNVRRKGLIPSYRFGPYSGVVVGHVDVSEDLLEVDAIKRPHE
jgi:hypothetical protein